MTPIVRLDFKGRFGNRLFQYIFARSYAERIGATLEVPPWQGPLLFNEVKETSWTDMDADKLSGFFTGPDELATWTRDYARRIYAFKPEILSQWTRPRDFYVAAHLRRGDFVIHQRAGITTFPIITKASYECAMMDNGFRPEDAIWVSDGDNLPSFAPDDISFANDFMTLLNANVLFIANSTFSWWAACLGHARTFVPMYQESLRPIDAVFVDKQVKEEGQPWMQTTQS